MAKLDPVEGWRPPSIASEVNLRLKAAILTGQFGMGEPLIQEDLCRQFQVSRQPVREALRQLESEGLVAIRERTGGYMVRVFSHDEIAEQYELRGVLESRLAAAAAERISGEDLQRLHESILIQERAVADDDVLGMVETNQRFHSLIWTAAAKPIHCELVTHLWASMSPRAPAVAGRALASIDEHKAIVEALTAGDPREASSTMTRHIRTGAIAAEAASNQRHEPSDRIGQGQASDVRARVIR